MILYMISPPLVRGFTWNDPTHSIISLLELIIHSVARENKVHNTILFVEMQTGASLIAEGSTPSVTNIVLEKTNLN